MVIIDILPWFLEDKNIKDPSPILTLFKGTIERGVLINKCHFKNREKTLIYGLIIVIWYTRQKYKNLQVNFSKNSTMWITPSVSSLSKHDQLKPVDGSSGDFAVNRNSLSFHAENADRLLKEMVGKYKILKNKIF